MSYKWGFWIIKEVVGWWKVQKRIGWKMFFTTWWRFTVVQLLQLLLDVSSPSLLLLKIKVTWPRHTSLVQICISLLHFLEFIGNIFYLDERSVEALRTEDIELNLQKEPNLLLPPQCCYFAVSLRSRANAGQNVLKQSSLQALWHTAGAFLFWFLFFNVCF